MFEVTNPKFWLIRPRPYEDEVVIGYYARVLALNGRSAASMEKSVPGRRLRQLDYIQLAERIYAANGGQPIANNPVDQYRASQCRAFCPACIKDEFYWRQIWVNRLYRSCHIHKLTLIRNCPACKQRLSWCSSFFKACRCGTHLSTMRSHAASPETLLVSEIAFEISKAERNRANKEKSEIRPVPSWEALRIIDDLLKTTAKACQTRGSKSSYSKMLNELLAPSRAIDNVERIKVVLTNLVAIHTDNDFNSSLSATKKISNAVHGVADTQLIQKLDGALRASDIAVRNRFLRHRVVTELTQNYSLPRSLQMVGLTKAQFFELVRFLISNRHLTYFTNGSSEVFNKIIEVTAGLRALQRVPEKFDVVSHLLAPGERLFERHARIFSDILDGKIRPVGQLRDLNGISGWVISFRDIKALMPRYQPKSRSLSPTSVGRILFVDQPTAAVWVRLGFIRSSPRSKAPLQVVSLIDLMTFQAEFITSKLIGRYVGRPLNIITGQLRIDGIEPVSGPHIDNAREALFRLDQQLLNFVKSEYQRDPPIGKEWNCWLDGRSQSNV